MVSEKNDSHASPCHHVYITRPALFKSGLKVLLALQLTVLFELQNTGAGEGSDHQPWVEQVGKHPKVRLFNPC